MWTQSRELRTGQVTWQRRETLLDLSPQADLALLQALSFCGLNELCSLATVRARRKTRARRKGSANIHSPARGHEPLGGACDSSRPVEAAQVCLEDRTSAGSKLRYRKGLLSNTPPTPPHTAPEGSVLRPLLPSLLSCQDMVEPYPGWRLGTWTPYAYCPAPPLIPLRSMI